MGAFGSILGDILSGGVSLLGGAIKGVGDVLGDAIKGVGGAIKGVGDALIPSSLKPYVQPVATGVGALFGPVGAAVGAGIGSYLAGNDSPLEALLGAGTAYAGGALTNKIAPFISELAGGGTIGNVAGQAVGGAALGTVSATPTAIKTGDLTPLAYGAGIGGLIGGVSAGGNELYDYITSPSATTIADQSMINAYNNRPESFIDAYLKQNPSYTPITADPTLSLLPQVITYNPFSTETLQGITGVQTNQPTLMGTKTPEQVYTDIASNNMFYRPSSDPNQIGTLGKVFDKEPTLFDKATEYAGTLGKAVLNNSDIIKQIAAGLTAAGATIYAPNVEDILNPKKSSDTYMETLVSGTGTGVGKSKGVTAGQVKALPYNGLSFIPNYGDISDYKDEDLYYI